MKVKNVVASILVVAAVFSVAQLVAKDNPFVNDEPSRPLGVVVVKDGNMARPFAFVSDEHKAAVEEFKQTITLVGEGKLDKSDKRVVDAQNKIDVLVGLKPAKEGEKAQIAEGVVALEAKKDGIQKELQELATVTQLVASGKLDKSDERVKKAHDAVAQIQKDGSAKLASEGSKKSWWRVGFWGGCGFGYGYPYYNYGYYGYPYYNYGIGYVYYNPYFYYGNYGMGYYGGYGRYGWYC